ncbi:MAG: DUF4157 domain-containing protein [Proteobacteria bacterium]|nr:DUF4157 domain-containing protein [Pseudomonadota bacterium]
MPPAVRAALARVMGEDVSQVRIIEHSRFARLHGRAVATTRPGRIYLRGAAAEFFGDPWLMLHEYWHVLRQWRGGRLTLARYLAECARRGYWNNRFEVEARQFADRYSGQLHALLHSTQQALAAVQPARDPHQGGGHDGGRER